MSRRFLTSSQVARLLAVSPKTICRWARDGKIDVALVTLGGHQRFDPEQIDQLRRRLKGRPERVRRIS